MNGSGSLNALNANVDFNGTTTAAAGAVTITGSGNIVADGTTGTNGLVNLNIGANKGTVSANSILGCLEDPNYSTVASDSVSITVAANSANGALQVGNFNATANANSTFSAANTQSGGGLTTCGLITANGTVANPVTLSADNITNDYTVTANTSDLVVSSSTPGNQLNLSMNSSGSLTASNANVDFNGTTTAAAGSVQITGAGNIVADGTTGSNGKVYLNIGSGTANVTANTIYGCVHDPNYNTVASGSVDITVAANGPNNSPLMVGNFNATGNAGATFSANNTTGDLATCGSITSASTLGLNGATSVTVSAGTTMTGGTGLNVNTPVFNVDGVAAASTGDLTVQNTTPGGTLTVNMGPNVGGIPAQLTANGAGGNVNFNSTTPGAIDITGGAGHGLISANNFVNLDGGSGTVNTDNNQISGCIGVTGSTIAVTTHQGDLDFCTPIDTSSNSGPGGFVSLTAKGGSVSTDAINTSGNVPGQITILAGTGVVSTGNLTADGINGAAGGMISITGTTVSTGDINANGGNGGVGGSVSVTGTNVTGTYISATGGGAGAGGQVNLTSANLALSGADGAGSSIDANSNGTGSGGTLNLDTTSGTPFIIGNNGAATGNGVNGAITANGVNGGFITLTNAGGLTVYGNVHADGTTGTGGNVLIQNSLTPGATPLVANIYGTIHADNNADDTGLIGFNSGPAQTITLLGTGTLWAGECVHVGNLDQQTLAFLNPPAGNVYYDTNLTIHPHFCSRSPIIPINPPPPPPPPSPSPTPATPGRPLGLPAPTTISVATASPPLAGEVNVFEMPEQANIPDSSKTATDLTQVLNIANLDQNEDLLQDNRYAKEFCKLIDGSRTHADQFDDSERQRLDHEGVKIASNTQGNYLNLDKGNIVFSPSKDIVVGTHEGDVNIASGSNVLVMETGHDVMIYNLHDQGRGRVSVTSANKKLTIEPGRMLVLSRQNARDFESIVGGCHCIAYRNMQEIDLDGSIKAFLGEFSIPSAFTMVMPLKQMMASNDAKDKATVRKILQTTVMLNNFMPASSPFKNGLPDR